MLTELKDLGLSEKEARVYLAALEIGHATADQLAKHAKIVRPTTYLQIKSLMEKGLISTYEEGKKTYFAPESPVLLKRFLAKQKEDIGSKERYLTNFLPELLRQFESAGERPTVRFFTGKEGVTAAREEPLKAKKKETFVIFSYDHLRKIFSEKELDDYSDRRRALGIHSRAIHFHKAYFEKAGLDSLTERRFLPLEELRMDIYVYDQNVLIYSLQGNPFALIINSVPISSSIKIIFEFLWEHAEGPKDTK